MCRHSWPGIACGFALFILVFIYDKLSGASICVLGKAEPSLLLFIVPGLAGGLLLRCGSLHKPLYGALLALPVCFLLLYVGEMPARPVLQEMAWLFSAVFWCAIGTLLSLFINRLRRHLRVQRRTHAR
ncbi:MULTISPECIES: inner membrane protein YbjM [Tenebrionibacter/Tenebrionicola group]|uniref:Inner membrane protein YbjM n=2 Tax=Tenebrionibacter/Tenebrionicola group TaxID=2969848 RepID=A0A8K0V0V0_9ENTR|nr:MULTISPECIES: inner membrane protein YbjM [Tenebrionibacter/Tenebrionicola group]MBK4714803.1 hypothetical protein [Tenebrionibacter intestinalis]MBV4412254.1 hypothetical protein [Tenebrionicola larvae]MBV5095548.1 hypothetical protein [Tenebrionicola larvae]